MSTSKTITCIIPTYRRPHLLQRAIKSVQAQTYPDLKICIYDNASGDETKEIVKELAKADPRIFYICNEKNIGGQANILNGIRYVSTAFYSILSDDDLLLPDFYSQAIKKFEENDEIMAVCSKTLVADLINKKLHYRNQEWLEGQYQPSFENACRMYQSHFVSTGVLFREQVRNIIGEFDHSGSDSLYLTILAATVKYAVINYYGAVVIQHSNAYSIVNENISAESVSLLSNFFNKTITQIQELSISDTLKTQLSFLIIKRYQELFESKKLKSYLSDSANAKQMNNFSLPSLLINRSLVNQAFAKSPPTIRKMLKFIYSHLNAYRHRKSFNTKNGWLPLVEHQEAAFTTNTYNKDNYDFINQQIES